VAVFDTDDNKYTEKLERKNAIERKKLITFVFRKSPRLAIAQNLCYRLALFFSQ